MVNNNRSGRTKRRKNVAYKTPKERQRLNSTNSRVTAPKARDNDKSRRTNSDTSVASALKTFEAGQVDSARTDSLSTASVSKVPEPPQSVGTKSPGKRPRQPSKQNDKKSGSGKKSQPVANSPKKRKISEKANDKAEINLNSNNSETRNRRKRRKSINFTTARERNRLDSRRQSEIDPDSSNQTSTLTGKENQSSSQPIVSEFQASQRDKEKSPGKRSTKSTGQRSNSSLKTAKTKNINKNSMKAVKTRTNYSDKSSSSETSMTQTTGTSVKTRQRKHQRIPDRIQDLSVTKKAFSRWKPLANTTKEFVEETLKSVMLNVIVDMNAQENPEASKYLKLLKDRVLERLPHLKAPYTRGDYRKMESQNKESEEALLEKSRELNALDEKIEEEQRLLEVESEMVEEYKNKLERCKMELDSLDHEKVHPLLRGETENVLDLPELPEEFFNDDEVVPLEADSVEEIHLAQTLSKLREKAGSIGLTRWMDRLGRLAEELEKD